MDKKKHIKDVNNDEQEVIKEVQKYVHQVNNVFENYISQIEEKDIQITELENEKLIAEQRNIELKKHTDNLYNENKRNKQQLDLVKNHQLNIATSIIFDEKMIIDKVKNKYKELQIESKKRIQESLRKAAQELEEYKKYTI